MLLYCKMAISGPPLADGPRAFFKRFLMEKSVE
jgi:hypothetical protein